MPPMQDSPRAQAWPQRPQFDVLLWRLKQTPLQFVAGGGHATWQTPLVQTWLAAHLMPQPPQLFTSVATRTQVLPHLV